MSQKPSEIDRQATGRGKFHCRACNQWLISYTLFNFPTFYLIRYCVEIEVIVHIGKTKVLNIKETQTASNMYLTFHYLLLLKVLCSKEKKYLDKFKRARLKIPALCGFHNDCSYFLPKFGTFLYLKN